MDSAKLSEGELTRLLFSAKAAAYVSPMTIKEWQDERRSDFVLVDVRKRHPRPAKKDRRRSLVAAARRGQSPRGTTEG
jgi:hypothetical protein